MRRSALLTTLALVAFAPVPAFAQFGGGFEFGDRQDFERLQRSFEIRTIGGNRLVGPLRATSMTIHTEEFGDLALPVDSLFGIRLASTDDGEDIVVATTGEVVKGRLQTEAFDIDSGFGPLSVARSRVETIRRYRFPGSPGADPLDAILRAATSGEDQGSAPGGDVPPPATENR